MDIFFNMLDADMKLILEAVTESPPTDMEDLSQTEKHPNSCVIKSWDDDFYIFI